MAEWPKRYDTSLASSFVPTTSGSGRPVFNSSASGRAAAEELNMAGSDGKLVAHARYGYQMIDSFL